MGILNVIIYILGIILLIILIILAIKCIKLVENANNLIVEIQRKVSSFDYIFDMIESFSLVISNISKKISYMNNKIFGNIFKRKENL